MLANLLKKIAKASSRTATKSEASAARNAVRKNPKMTGDKEKAAIDKINAAEQKNMSAIVKRGADAKPKTKPRSADAVKRARNEAEAKITPQRGSIATKSMVSKTDIKQANTARQFDALQRRIDNMKDGMIKKSMQQMLKAQRRKFEKMQADEVDTVSRKSAQSARDRKMKGKVTLPPTPFRKGGYNKGMKK